MLCADGLLTVDDLTKRYGVSKAGIYQLLRQARLPRGLKIGRRRLWRPEQLTTWEAEQERGPSFRRDV